MAGAPEHTIPAPRVGEVGPDRDRRQPGDRQRDLPAAVAGPCEGRCVGTACVSGRRLAVPVDRLVLRRSGQPLRSNRRPDSSRARGVRTFRRFRSRLAAVVRASGQSRLGGQRPHARAGVLLAIARRWVAEGGHDHGPDHLPDVDQRPRRQAVVVGGQRVDHRQACAAGDLHPRRHLVYRSVAPHAPAAGDAESRCKAR